jgi:hypothetical protein
MVEWLSPLADQALAGATMKVFGLVFFGVPFARIFFEWYQSENAPQHHSARHAAHRRRPAERSGASSRTA